VAAAICSTGQQCLAWYLDCDSDGFGANSAPVFSCSQPAPGTCQVLPNGDKTMGSYISNTGDCCDMDSQAFPGQTQFFSSPDACGSYDYNCDNQSTLHYPAQTCSALTCAIVNGACVPSAGCAGTGCKVQNNLCVTSANAAACGAPINATFQLCAFLGPIVCQPMTENDTVQSCL